MNLWRAGSGKMNPWTAGNNYENASVEGRMGVVEYISQ